MIKNIENAINCFKNNDIFIEQLIHSSQIMVFMKGTKLMPQCGFSNNVVQILNSLGMNFETFDVNNVYSCFLRILSIGFKYRPLEIIISHPDN